MEGCIYGVSLGPGDPDLITIKALRLIKTADRVYYPGTVGAGGRVGGVAIGILEAYSIPEDRMSGMLVPMSRHRDAAESCYEENYGRIAADARAGKRVVVVSVGDSGFSVPVRLSLSGLCAMELPLKWFREYLLSLRQVQV